MLKKPYHDAYRSRFPTRFSPTFAHSSLLPHFNKLSRTFFDLINSMMSAFSRFFPPQNKKIKFTSKSRLVSSINKELNLNQISFYGKKSFSLYNKTIRALWRRRSGGGCSSSGTSSTSVDGKDTTTTSLLSAERFIPLREKLSRQACARGNTDL